MFRSALLYSNASLLLLVFQPKFIIILHSNITNTARPQGLRDSRANTDESRIFFMYIK